jgi:hypothetical protein
MMTRLKRFNGFLLSAALLALSNKAQAQFTFTTNIGALTLTGYTGSDRAVTIPAITNGLSVVSIGSCAFSNNPTLFSLTIPASVTNYVFTVFFSCTNLTAVFFQGNAPQQYGGAGPLFWRDYAATLYYLQGTPGWGAGKYGLPTVQWDPQVLDQLIYTTNDDTITITGYTGPGGAIVIPSAINGFPVTGVAGRVFLGSTTLTSITLPNTTKNMGDLAFASCTALTNFAMPPSAVGSGLLSNCTALANVVIYANVASIGESEFSGCTALTNMTIPATVTNIGDWAFQNCSNLNAVYFQGNAPLADATIFDGASNVTNYYLPQTAGWGATFMGRPAVPILFTFTTNGGTITITKYIGIGGSVVVPDTINGLRVTMLGNVTFTGCANLTNIILGTNIAAIAGQAFVGCSDLVTIMVNPLNAVYSSLNGVLFDKSQATLISYPHGRAGGYTLPASVTSIAGYTFQNCASLTSVTLPSSLISIGGMAFAGCTSLHGLYFQGNAPSADWTVFIWYDDGYGTHYLPNATVYYLPGTTGWGSSFESLPTAPWFLPNPLILSRSPSFGVHTNRFGFIISWATNLSVIVEACTNLGQGGWSPVSTNTLINGWSYFSDPQWMSYPSRFYHLSFP